MVILGFIIASIFGRTFLANFTSSDDENENEAENQNQNNWKKILTRTNKQNIKFIKKLKIKN